MENIGRDVGNQGLGLHGKPASPLETSHTTPPFHQLQNKKKILVAIERKIFRKVRQSLAFAENFSLDSIQDFSFSPVLRATAAVN